MSRTCGIVLAALACLALLPVGCHAERNLKRPPGTTRYAPMVAQLQALLDYDRTQGEGRMRLSSLGRSVKGREIWMVTLREPEQAAPIAPYDAQSSQAEPEGQDTPGSDVGAGSPRPSAQTSATGQTTTPAPKKLFYLCRQHGHEPASTEGALAFIRDLVKAPADAPLVDDLRRVTVYVVPMANPDGAEAFLRHNAHDVDLNRDWLRRTQPETRAWWKAIQSLRPDLVTDQHELYPNDTRGDFTETAGEGSGAEEELIQTCAGTATTVQASMSAAGFPVTCHWITDHHPARLAHRYNCVVAGVPTILFETNRLQGSGRDVAARGRTHYQFMVTTLRDLAGERPQLLAEASSRTGSDRGFLLASRHRAYQRQAAPVAPSAPDNGTAGAPAAPAGAKDGE